MKKILVLGAGGFIGSHMVDELLRKKHTHKRKYEITALDLSRQKLNEGIDQAADVLRMDKKRLHRQIKYVEMDITDKENNPKLKRLVRQNDIIVNLIAICNPALYVKEPLSTFEVGFLGNLKFVDWCAEYHKRLIQFSTCEVYGKSPSIFAKNRRFFFNEEKSYCIMGPVSKQRWIYATSKQLLERVIHAHGLRGDLTYSIIRPFNFIGERIDYLPSQQKGNPRVFSHFIDNLMLGKPLMLVNGGFQRRCYCYIKDATDAHIRIIENKDGKCTNQIFNIGVLENETTIRNLALLMREIYKKQFLLEGHKLSPVKSIPGDKFYGEGYDDCDRRLIDNSKLKRLTGWKPKYDLKTMDYNIMKYYFEKMRSNQIC
jgi:nucleoside-diphosphate-sugar epimerase